MKHKIYPTLGGLNRVEYAEIVKVDCFYEQIREICALSVRSFVVVISKPDNQGWTPNA